MQNFITIGSVVYERIEDKQTNKHTCLFYIYRLGTCIFPDIRILGISFVTPIFKSSMRNDISNYRGIAILSAIDKLFELLVYRVMYEDLRSRHVDCQHGFIKGRLTLYYLLEYSSFVLKSNIAARWI
jgi:hypothetical protein